MSDEPTWAATLYGTSGRRRETWFGPSFPALAARLSDPDANDVVQAHVRAPDGQERVLVREAPGAKWSNASKES